MPTAEFSKTECPALFAGPQILLRPFALRDVMVDSILGNFASRHRNRHPGDRNGYTAAVLSPAHALRIHSLPVRHQVSEALKLISKLAGDDQVTEWAAEDFLRRVAKSRVNSRFTRTTRWSTFIKATASGACSNNPSRSARCFSSRSTRQVARVITRTMRVAIAMAAAPSGEMLMACDKSETSAERVKLAAAMAV